MSLTRDRWMTAAFQGMQTKGLNVSELVVIPIVWECLWKCVLWFRSRVLKNVNHLAVTEKHRHKPQAE